jgi:hypothetical protein
VPIDTASKVASNREVENQIPGLLSWRATNAMTSNIASPWRLQPWLVPASRVGHEFFTSPRCKIYRGGAQGGVIVEVF